MDLSFFATPEAWISLVTLTFLEIVLGVDNIVFIALTTGRLPEEKQHIGRRAGLIGALVMRVAFLSVASYLVHMVKPLFTIDLGFYSHGFAVRDLVLFVGGAYLLYKGIDELVGMVKLKELKEEHSAKDDKKSSGKLTLPQAVGTIMVMDLVFSIDSVITAVGMANHLIIMILAVMIAIVIMMVFIDFISNFINQNVEMKILALVFIVAIGVLLVLDGLGITTGIEVLDMHMEKLMVYFAMVFSVILEIIQLVYKRRYTDWTMAHQASAEWMDSDQIKDMHATQAAQAGAHARLSGDDGK